MDPSDVIACDPSRSTGPLSSPPRGWPGCFSKNLTLKAFMGKKQLAGVPCRVPPTCGSARWASVGEPLTSARGRDRQALPLDGASHRRGSAEGVLHRAQPGGFVPECFDDRTEARVVHHQGLHCI